jgi:hypothetical protein
MKLLAVDPNIEIKIHVTSKAKKSKAIHVTGSKGPRGL